MTHRAHPWAGRKAPRMTDHRRHEYRRYLRFLAPRLGLGDWKIVVWAEPAIAMSNAEVEVRWEAHYLRIWFAPSFPQLSQADQRTACVHELLHVYIDPMGNTVKDFKPLLSPELYVAMYEQHERHLEVATETLAKLIAPMHPTPAQFLRGPATLWA